MEKSNRVFSDTPNEDIYFLFSFIPSVYRHPRYFQIGNIVKLAVPRIGLTSLPFFKKKKYPPG